MTEIPVSTCNKRRSLSFNEKKEIIDTFKNANLSKAKFAKFYGIPRTTLNNILSNESNMDFFVGNRKRKRQRVSTYDKLEEALLNWIEVTRSENIHVSTIMLKEKALEIAKELGQPNFTACNGWIQRFKTRNCISFARPRKGAEEAMVIEEEEDENELDKISSGDPEDEDNTPQWQHNDKMNFIMEWRKSASRPINSNLCETNYGVAPTSETPGNTEESNPSHIILPTDITGEPESFQISMKSEASQHTGNQNHQLGSTTIDAKPFEAGSAKCIGIEAAAEISDSFSVKIDNMLPVKEHHVKSEDKGNAGESSRGVAMVPVTMVPFDRWISHEDDEDYAFARSIAASLRRIKDFEKKCQLKKNILDEIVKFKEYL